MYNYKNIDDEMIDLITQNCGGKNRIIPGRVVKPKQTAFPGCNRLYRVVDVTNKGVKLRSEHGDILSMLYDEDDLIVAR